jgi:hypothetical protein
LYVVQVLALVSCITKTAKKERTAQNKSSVVDDDKTFCCVLLPQGFQQQSLYKNTFMVFTFIQGEKNIVL